MGNHRAGSIPASATLQIDAVRCKLAQIGEVPRSLSRFVRESSPVRLGLDHCKLMQTVLIQCELYGTNIGTSGHHCGHLSPRGFPPLDGGGWEDGSASHHAEDESS